MNVKDLEDNLKKTFSYNIKHLSAYLLSIEEGTVFYRMKKKGNLEETDEEESIASSTGSLKLLRKQDLFIMRYQFWKRGLFFCS
jgi:coproporphyrinogen III oxidase-like Fe-S oxidoreductase